VLHRLVNVGGVPDRLPALVARDDPGVSKPGGSGPPMLAPNGSTPVLALNPSGRRGVSIAFTQLTSGVPARI